MKPPKKPATGQARHGPAPLRLKIEGDLGEAVGRMMRAGKPPPEKKPAKPKKR